MAISEKTLMDLLQTYFEDAEVVIDDLSKDGEHYAVTVRSKSFQGKSRVEQHQMVYEALRGAMASDLHALVIKTEALEG